MGQRKYIVAKSLVFPKRCDLGNNSIGISLKYCEITSSEIKDSKVADRIEDFISKIGDNFVEETQLAFVGFDYKERLKASTYFQKRCYEAHYFCERISGGNISTYLELEKQHSFNPESMDHDDIQMLRKLYNRDYVIVDLHTDEFANKQVAAFTKKLLQVREHNGLMTFFSIDAVTPSLGPAVYRHLDMLDVEDFLMFNVAGVSK